ncbi:hypothetical protein LJC27_02900 [Christensenellaceae bacterium OttesenSCG-928-M15]|nr:hypothetical protein [Christensenellaceae bacterium OttesenSCG-928-M15]
MFFTKLWRALKLGLRTMKNVLFRPFRAIVYRLRRASNVSRQATKAAPQIAKKITKVKLKPETREDYIETKNAYIAKPMFLAVILALAAIGLLVYFVIWPLLLRFFFVAHIEASASDAQTHTGRAVLYYDGAKEERQFEGRLESGIKTGTGKEYYQDGTLAFEGEYRDGLYDGKGKLYDEAGQLLYEGEFRAGTKSGQGTLYASGVRVYSGTFAQDVPEGTGKSYLNGDELVYEGAFSAGAPSGQGKVYENGILRYEGGYLNGGFSGAGKLYYPSGAIEMEGTFNAGYLTGSGVQYYENGNVKYRGNFDMGEYAAEGTLFSAAGITLYKGGFSMGLYEGAGTTFYTSGIKHIVGTFEAGEPVGDVRIYDESGAYLYNGGFENGNYQGEGRLYQSAASYIDATFEQGNIVGVVSIYEEGALRYQGGYQNGCYEGNGKLYNVLGDILYSGRFSYGVPDGLSLINQSVEQIPALFGEGNYIVLEKEEGVYYISTKYSVAAFVNYPSQEHESVVHRFYVYDVDLLNSYLLTTLPHWGAAPPKLQSRVTPLIDTVPIASGSSMQSGRTVLEQGFVTAWAGGAEEPVCLIEFMSREPLPLKPVEAEEEPEELEVAEEEDSPEEAAPKRASMTRGD